MLGAGQRLCSDWGPQGGLFLAEEEREEMNRLTRGTLTAKSQGPRRWVAARACYSPDPQPSPAPAQSVPSIRVQPVTVYKLFKFVDCYPKKLEELLARSY